jgi:hypothetical protein
VVGSPRLTEIAETVAESAGQLAFVGAAQPGLRLCSCRVD